MSEFKGLTVEYKNSEEYKGWLNAIKHDNPDLPEALIDIAILHHYKDKFAYKNAYKESKLPKPEPKKFTEEDLTLYNLEVLDAKPIENNDVQITENNVNII